MLLSLFGLISTTVSAQDLNTVGNYIVSGDFIYKVITAYDPTTPAAGTVSIEAIRATRNPVDAEGKLNLVGHIETDLFEDHYEFDVVKITAGALQIYGTATTGTATYAAGTAFDHIVDAKSVVIPKEFTTVETGTFVSYTNISSITFEADSKLTTVQSQAFTTTQTKVFDFRPCTKLYALPDEAFVETGLTNTYITTVILPDHSADSPVVPFTLDKSLIRLPKLTTITNLNKCNVQTFVTDAFNGDASLATLEIPASTITIQDGAFQNSGIKDLTINVGNLTTFGQGTGCLFGNTPTTSPEILESLTLKGVLNTTIAANAFAGCTNLATLDMTGMTFKQTTISPAVTGKGAFAANSFQNCTSLTALAFPPLRGAGASSTVIGAAFAGCTSLAEVSIHSILTDAGAIAVAANAFGTNLKTVTIGTIDVAAATNVPIAAGAFVYGDVSGATLKIATGASQYLNNSGAGAVGLIAAGAFDFSAITVTPARTEADYPTVQIGQINSGAIFVVAALKGDQIMSITFTGTIANGGLDGFTNPIIDNTGTPALKELTFQGNLGTGTTAAAVIGAKAFAGLPNLETITFDGDIIPGAIAGNAFGFASMAQKVTITFNGDLKATAASPVILAGAFEKLPATSEIHYTKSGATTVANPFAATAFDNTTPAVVGTTRDIVLVVSDATLAALYADGTNGLSTGNAWDIFRVIAASAPVYATPLIVYPNENQTTVAWARNPIVPGAGKDYRTITRVQDIEGEGEVKLTLYQTYTDEDPFDKQSTIYMVPLQAYNGVYYLPSTTIGNDLKTIVAKAEKKDGSVFVTTPVAPATVPAVEFKVIDILTADLPATAASSIWKLSTDANLHKATNIMTNQQLVDGTAVNTGDAFNAGQYLYTGWDGVVGTDIVRDIYIMTDPSKGKGVRIDKMAVTSTNNAYINNGWWFWMLAKFNDEAEARVIWLGEDDNVTSILGVKKNVKKFEADAVYNLQGVRVDNTVKGQVYIMNGKKFIAQ